LRVAPGGWKRDRPLLQAAEPPDGEQQKSSPDKGRRRAAGIYGTIVTAAVIVAGGIHLRTGALVVLIVGTLLVYWVAEQYAVLIGEHAQGGNLPSRADVRSSLTETWPMVTASAVPVLALVIARAAGLSAENSAWTALYVTIGLLIVHGWTAGRASGLTGVRLVGVTLTAGFLGAVMVALKALIQHHH
jgi:hypothetical protein